MTRASFKFVGLSSTISIASFAIAVSPVDPARQDRREHAAGAELARHLDAPAVLLDDPLGQREPEAGALVALRRARVDLLELDEQLRHVVLRDADAGVAH